jgi:hypothetical protein
MMAQQRVAVIDCRQHRADTQGRQHGFAHDGTMAYGAAQVLRDGLATILKA